MDDITYGFLNNFYNRSSLSLHDLSVLLDLNSMCLTEPIQSLLEKKYIEPVPPSTFVISQGIPLTEPFRITYAGRTALLLYRQEKRRFRFSEFRAWATLTIALVALVLSLINTVSQFL